MVYAVVLLLILLFVVEQSTERNAPPAYSPSLEDDGLILLDHPDPSEVLQHLPDGYTFLDYKYTIHGCTLSTFHRDVTSSQYVFNTKHPVYTFITYKYDGPSLTVCPGSHRTAPFLFSNPVTINANSVLFNCDVVHAGSLNLGKKPRTAVQYKIAHRDDIGKLSHLMGVRKVKDGDCDKRNNVLADIVYRKISLIFSFVSNHVFTPFLQNRESPLLCKLIGEERCFYNA